MDRIFLLYLRNLIFRLSYEKIFFALFWYKTTMSQIFSDFFRYKDKFGLIQDKSDGQNGLTSQNGTLFTYEYLMCLLSNIKEFSKEGQKEIDRIGNVFDSCELFPGISCRAPDSVERDSMDNNSALLAYSYLYGESMYATRMYVHGRSVSCTGVDEVDDNIDLNKKGYILARILRFGRKPKFFWNTRNPSKFSFFPWFQRSPGFMGLLEIAAFNETSLLKATSLFIGQMIGCFSNVSNLDARKLAYVTWSMLKDRGIIWRLGYKFWCWKLMRDYPNGMKDVYARYYGSEHPLVKYSKEFIP